MYQIVSKSGWRTAANTAQEAKALADDHHRKWYEVGRDIEVCVYYFGDLVYSTSEHKSATS